MALRRLLKSPNARFQRQLQRPSYATSRANLRPHASLPGPKITVFHFLIVQITSMMRMIVRRRGKRKRRWKRRRRRRRCRMMGRAAVAAVAIVQWSRVFNWSFNMVVYIKPMFKINKKRFYMNVKV
eukprot:scaffold31943_cov40-Cyclotella_meneghiniana.AAC.2